MNLYEAIKTRRSSRNYLPTPVEQDKLDRIWEAVRLAPSACNIQPWRFLLIKSESMKQRLTGILQPWALTAPLIVVALGNRNSAWHRDGQSIHEVDVAIAFEHLVLAAAAEGLGTCWICAFNRQALHKAIGIAGEWDVVAATPLGYSSDSGARTERKALNEILQLL